MTERLFFKNLKVQFRSQGHVERRGIIRITVETQTTTTPMQRRDLVVRITDDSDPEFLYNLCLSEEDFQDLKNQQGLRIDFSAFPENIVGFLNDCIDQQDESDPQLVLEFWLNNGNLSQNQTGILKIIHINSFKNLQHLALTLVHANDSDVKKYLASCLKVVREKLNKERCQYESLKRSLTNELDDNKEQLKEQSIELEKLKSESTGEVGRLVSVHHHELNVEKQKHLTIQEQLQHRHEKEKNEMQQRLQSIIDRKESDLEELKNWKFHTQATIQKKDTNLDMLNKELDCSLKKYQNVRIECNYFKKQCLSKSETLKQVEAECRSLEQEVTDLQNRLSHVCSSLEVAEKKNKECECLKASLIKKKENLEMSIKTMHQEAQKADEIIRRFKTQLKNYMGKNKVLNEVTVRQEKMVEEQNKKLEHSEKQLTAANSALNEKEKELKGTKDELELKTKKLNETAELIKSNDYLIKYLNKQINEAKVSSQPQATTYTHASQPQQNVMYHGNRLSENTNQVHTYSTPVGSYIPGIQSSQHIGVSTITTSPNLKPVYSQHQNSTKEEYTGNLGKSGGLSSSFQSSGAKNKENHSPSELPIRAEYFVKSTDETTPEITKPFQMQPGAISLKTFQRNSNRGIPSSLMVNTAAQNHITSAYFDGKLPKLS